MDNGKEINLAVVKDCWIISGGPEIELIVKLKILCAGLKKDTKLTFKRTDDSLDWLVVSRLIYSHIENRQRHFENETIELRYSASIPPSLRDDDDRVILNEEIEGIYHYKIKGINHSLHPTYGDKLEIIRG
jgi:hypothetical protein